MTVMSLNPHMLAPRITLTVVLALLGGTALAQSTGPLTTLAASYVAGEQLSLEVTADGTRGFLAEGARVALLDLTGSAPVEISFEPLEDFQPLAMRHFLDSSGAHNLFVAGGALGVVRLIPCAGWFQTPINCPSGIWVKQVAQAPLEYGYFERKRYVDVEVLSSSNGPRLFALFAASSDPNQSFGGPTELREYSWTPQAVTPVASYVFPSASSPVQVGTALAVDTSDPDSLYVGLGKGGIWRAFHGTGGLTATKIWDPACPTCPANCGSSPEHVRDLTIVHATNPPVSVLYAALSYGELLEIVDPRGTATCRITQIRLSQPSGVQSFPEKIAAIVQNGSQVHVVVAAQTAAGKSEDGAGPWNVNSGWDGICFGPMDVDHNAPAYVGCHSLVQHLTRNLTQGGSTLSVVSTLDYGADDVGWNSEVLLVPPLSSNARLFACSRWYGFQTYDLDTSGQFQQRSTYVASAVHAQNGVVSLLNPGVVQFLGEWTGAVLEPKSMLYIDPTSQPVISPIAETQWSPCAYDYRTAPLCQDPNGVRDPGLYTGAGIFEVAHWIDSSNPGREYFVAGRRLLEAFDSTCGPPPTDPQGCMGNPCSGAGSPNWWYRVKDFDSSQPLVQARNGWRVTSLAIPSQGSPSDGPSMAPGWWQIDTPNSPIESATDDRVQSLADPRKTGSVPNAIYLSRSGMSYIKVIRASDIQQAAQNACAPVGNGTVLPASALPTRTALLHVELQDNYIPGTPPLEDPANNPCNPQVVCDGSIHAGPHFSMSGHTRIFRTRDGSGGSMYVLASASGACASAAGGNQTNQCQWASYSGLPMLTLFDVTQTGSGSFAAPRLLRVGLGSVPGNAICVDTTTVNSKTFAYVGDIVGNIWVYNVTGTELLPPAPEQPPPPTPPSTQYTYLGSNTPILSPIAVLKMPVDPFDGIAANCIDIEIVGQYLYCALGRQGVGVVNISNPGNPQLVAVLDTPGLVLGITSRSFTVQSTQYTQLVVGDSRCGVRIYR